MDALLPLAAGLDWIEGILPVLFLLVWIVSQVRNLFRGGEPAQPRRPVVPRRGPVPPPADGDARQELTRQIEEFLRRANGEPPRVPQADPRRGAATPAGGRDARPQPRRSDPPPLPTARPVVRERRPTPAAPTQSRAIGTLGGHATDVSTHVRDAFAHELEHLPSGLGASATPAATTAGSETRVGGIVQMLRDPATLRQMVIVREVLDRPVDRW